MGCSTPNYLLLVHQNGMQHLNSKSMARQTCAEQLHDTSTQQYLLSPIAMFLLLLLMEHRSSSKANRSSDVGKISAFHKPLRFITMFTKACKC
jgi:hypothetical protein